MRNLALQHLLILIPVLLVSYTNTVLKWQVPKLPTFAESDGILHFLLVFFTNIWILSAFAAAAISSIVWMLALRYFDISYAYPFISLSFLMVAVAGTALLGEKISVMSLFGLFFIILGVGLTAKGSFYK